jgi:hypothetical protein
MVVPVAVGGVVVLPVGTMIDSATAPTVVNALGRTIPPPMTPGIAGARDVDTTPHSLASPTMVTIQIHHGG